MTTSGECVQAKDSTVYKVGNDDDKANPGVQKSVSKKYVRILFPNQTISSRLIVSIVPDVDLLHFADKEALQIVGQLKVLRIRAVVGATVVEDTLHVGDEQMLVDVVAFLSVLSLQTLLHRGQVHRVLDVLIVAGCLVSLDRTAFSASNNCDH